MQPPVQYLSSNHDSLKISKELFNGNDYVSNIRSMVDYGTLNSRLNSKASITEDIIFTTDKNNSIRRTKVQKIYLNFNHFKKTFESDNVIGLLLDYLNNYEHYALDCSNMYFRALIRDRVKNISKSILMYFDQKYKNNFKERTSKLKINHKFNTSYNSSMKIFTFLDVGIDLIIKFRISFNDLTDILIKFGYLSRYPSDKESYKNIFQFTIKPNTLSFWIMREYTMVFIIF